MGLVNFRKKSDLSENELWVRNSIERRLKKRGLKMVDLENWEVHGEHPDMNYQVWIGGVKFIKKGEHLPNSNRDEFLVAIYPRRIFVIDDFSDWWRAEEESQI